MRKLLYVPGSPFARKLRIVLAEKGLDYIPVELASYPPGPAVSAHNPARQVPVLLDGDIELFDSGLILAYLLETYPTPAYDSPSPPLAAALTRPRHHWQDAKILTVLDTVADTMVTLAYLDWCGLQATGANVIGFDYRARLGGRVQSCLDWLDAQATPEGFHPDVFSHQDIALICPLLWTDARTRIPWRGRANLEAIVARYADRPSVAATPVPPFPALNT